MNGSGLKIYSATYPALQLQNSTTGTNNTAIGNAAGLNSQQGASNTFVGYAADIDTNAASQK